MPSLLLVVEKKNGLASNFAPATGGLNKCDKRSVAVAFKSELFCLTGCYFVVPVIRTSAFLVVLCWGVAEI